MPSEKSAPRESMQRVEERGETYLKAEEEEEETPSKRRKASLKMWSLEKSEKESWKPIMWRKLESWKLKSVSWPILAIYLPVRNIKVEKYERKSLWNY